MTDRGHLEIKRLADRAAVIWAMPCANCGGHRAMIWCGGAAVARQQADTWSIILGVPVLDPECLN